MFRQHDLIESATMERGVHLWRYGSWGRPLLVFPSAAGMAHEWEAHGMIDALAPLVEAGKLKLYCTESNVAEAWTRKGTDPAWRIGRHGIYERYVLQDLVPFIYRDCRTESIPIAVAGASLGAYYAANFALKFPHVFRHALCLSGRYDVRFMTDGFSSPEIYFNNPLAYVPGLEGEALEHVRKHTHLDLVCGQGPFEEGCIEETRALAEVCRRKGISCDEEIWGRDVAHDWNWWRRQAVMHLGRRFG